MKIVLTTPIISGRHGGVRNLLEISNRLLDFGHSVTILNESKVNLCDWFEIDKRVKIANSYAVLKSADCIVIGSPHSIRAADGLARHQKCFVYMQMAEHLFQEDNRQWFRQCKQFYLSRYPMIHGSRWGEEYVKSIGRTGLMHYITTGTNLKDFPISDKPKTGKSILLESPEPNNPSKDCDRLALKVAQRLKVEGYKVLAYGSRHITRYADVVDEFYLRPSLEEMNRLYEEATILIKATRFDARSTAPLEAMTKGTVTARAIEKGDDDLTDGVNCLKVGYNLEELYNAAKALLTDDELRNKLADNCRQYIQEHSWEKIMPEFNRIICS